MKTKSLLNALFLALLMVITGMIKLHAQTFTVDNLIYSINGDGVSVTLTGPSNGNSYSGELIIPESVTYEGINLAVTAIDTDAFADCTGLSGLLVIPHTLTYLGNHAFENCSGIDSLYIECGGELGNNIFQNCSGLKYLELSDTVTPFGAETFVGCTELETIIVGTGNIYYDSRDNCNAIIRTSSNNLILGCKNTIFPNTITGIANKAFYGCTGLTGELVLPNSVTTIGANAFTNCTGLTGELVLPNSVTTIGADAFTNCTGLTGSLIIPNSVTQIARSFKNCTGLTNVTIGKSVTAIMSNAFQNCSGINSIVLLPNTPPNTNTSYLHLGTSCTNLIVRCGNQSAYEGSNWTNVFETIEEDCNNYQITVENNNGGTITPSTNTAQLGQDVSIEITYNTGFEFVSIIVCKADDETMHIPVYNNSFTMPNFDIKITAYFYYNGFLYNNLQYCLNSDNTTVTVVGHINGIQASGAIVIPNNAICSNISYPIVAIAPNAFNGCSGITSLSVGEHVATIGSNAFSGCNNITTLSYNCPANILDYINKTSIVTLNIGNQVTSIPDYSFNNCTNLTTLTIGNSVTYIGQSAFNNCTGLLSAIIPDAVTEISNNSFHNCTNLTVASIGNGVTTIGNDAFNGCLQLMSFSLGEGIETIGDRAFMNCGIIGDIIVGQNVSYIGNESFKNCYGISEIISLRIAAPLLGNETFDGINPDISIYIPCGSTNLYAGRWSYFHNFNEIPFLFRAVSEDETKGIVVIMSVPTCESPQALVRAIAHPFYQFDHWSDGNTSNPYVYQVTGSVTLIAYFKSLVGEEENQEIPVSIYPNPTNGIVKIETENIQNISIYNIFGAKVFSESANGDSFEYDFSKHTAGIYIIRVETAQGTVTKQIVVK